MTVRTAQQIKTNISDLQRECDVHSNEFYKAKKTNNHNAMQWHYQSYVDKQKHIAQLIDQLGPRKIDESEPGYDNLTDTQKGFFHRRFYDNWVHKRNKSWGWGSNKSRQSDDYKEADDEVEYHGVKSWNFLNPTKPIKKLKDRENYLEEAYDNTSPEMHKEFVRKYHDLSLKSKKIPFAHKEFVGIRDEHIGYYNEKSKNKLSVEGDNLVHRTAKGKKIDLYPKPLWQRVAGLYENYGYDQLDVQGKIDFHDRYQTHLANVFNSLPAGPKRVEVNNEYIYHQQKSRALKMIRAKGIKDI